MLLNSFSNNKDSNWSKLKAFADDKINVTEKLRSAFGWKEKIVGKGELHVCGQNYIIFRTANNIKRIFLTLLHKLGCSAMTSAGYPACSQCFCFLRLHDPLSSLLSTPDDLILPLMLRNHEICIIWEGIVIFVIVIVFDLLLYLPI